MGNLQEYLDKKLEDTRVALQNELIEYKEYLQSHTNDYMAQLISRAENEIKSGQEKATLIFKQEMADVERRRKETFQMSTVHDIMEKSCKDRYERQLKFILGVHLKEIEYYRSNIK
ncbi:MAG: hypothetical protein ACOYMB_04850 [Patescibacteria group bacterium]